MNLSQMIVRRDGGMIKYRAAGITHRAAAVSNIPSSGRDQQGLGIGGRGFGNGSRSYEKGTALIFRSKAYRRAVIVPERVTGLMHGSSGPRFKVGGGSNACYSQHTKPVSISCNTQVAAGRLWRSTDGACVFPETWVHNQSKLECSASG
jgi:hypothetical protein